MVKTKSLQQDPVSFPYTRLTLFNDNERKPHGHMARGAAPMSNSSYIKCLVEDLAVLKIPLTRDNFYLRLQADG